MFGHECEGYCGVCIAEGENKISKELADKLHSDHGRESVKSFEDAMSEGDPSPP